MNIYEIHPVVGGSYTVEAAIIMPMIVLLIAYSIHFGIGQYMDINAVIDCCEETNIPRAVETVQKLLLCEDLLEDIEWK